MQVTAELQSWLDESPVGRVVANGRLDRGEVIVDEAFSLTYDPSEMDQTHRPPGVLKENLETAFARLLATEETPLDTYSGPFHATYSPDDQDEDSEPQVNIEFRANGEGTQPALLFG